MTIENKILFAIIDYEQTSVNDTFALEWQPTVTIQQAPIG